MVVAKGFSVFPGPKRPFVLSAGSANMAACRRNALLADRASVRLNVSHHECSLRDNFGRPDYSIGQTGSSFWSAGARRLASSHTDSHKPMIGAPTSRLRLAIV